MVASRREDDSERVWIIWRRETSGMGCIRGGLNGCVSMSDITMQ